jgi:hypothetical protein
VTRNNIAFWQQCHLFPSTHLFHGARAVKKAKRCEFYEVQCDCHCFNFNNLKYRICKISVTTVSPSNCVCTFNSHGSVHCRYESVKITNKMQPCNSIYYSKVYWRLNMFQATYHSSSGALNCICSLWFIHTCGYLPLSRFDNGRSPHVYINQRLQIQFRAPDDERYAAWNMLSLQ